MHRVDGMRGVYIASVFKDGQFDADNQVSMITFDKGGLWKFLDVSSVEVHMCTLRIARIGNGGNIACT